MPFNRSRRGREGVCRVHCEALAKRALMLLNNSGDGSNSNSNADDEYGCKTRRRQRIASKTKRKTMSCGQPGAFIQEGRTRRAERFRSGCVRRKQSLSKWLKRSLKRAEMEKEREDGRHQPMDFDDDDDDDDDNNDKKRRTTIQSPLWHCQRNDIVLAAMSLNDGDHAISSHHRANWGER